MCYDVEEKVQEEIRQIMTSPAQSSPQRPQPLSHQQDEIEHVLHDGAINDILHLDESIPPFFISEDVGDDGYGDDILSPLSVLESVTPSPISPTPSNSKGKPFSSPEHSNSSNNAGKDSSSSSPTSYWRLAVIVAGISLFAGVVVVAMVVRSRPVQMESNTPFSSQPSVASSVTEPTVSMSTASAARELLPQQHNFVAASIPAPTLSTLALPLLPLSFPPTVAKHQQPASLMPPSESQEQQQHKVETVIHPHISPTAAFSLLLSSLKHATGDIIRRFRVKIHGLLTGAKDFFLRVLLKH